MPDELRPLPYLFRARVSDWWNGLRDGWRHIPARPEREREEPISAPHRDFVISETKQVYESERIRYERSRVELPGRIARARSAERAAQKALDLASDRLTRLMVPLTEAEETTRLPGDRGIAEAIVRRRRRNKRSRQVSKARNEVAAAEARRDHARDFRIETEALEDQLLDVASARVRIAEQLCERRLAAYLRSLLRFHPEKAWVADQLRFGGNAPPWATREPVDLPPPEIERPPRENSREIPLLSEETVFGADCREPYKLFEPYAAPRHFRVVRDGDRLVLRDFRAGNGPYIQGRVVREAFLRPGDHFDFGDYRFYVREGLEYLDAAQLGVRKIVVHELEATTDDTFRLRDMSFVQTENTLLAILGPSGAGKSSLFSALLGELPITKGELYFEGLALTARGPQIRERLGFVPQSVDLLTTLTVEQSLRYTYRLRGPGQDADRRVAEVCRSLKLTERLGYRVGSLSGGQQRRVSIAMELLNGPKLLMLDEPTSGLDPGLDHEVMTLLRGYAEQQGATVMVVTHAVEHLGQAHRVLVVVKQGRPAYYGPPEDVLSSLDRERWAALMKDLDVEADRFAADHRALKADQEAADTVRQIREKQDTGDHPEFKARGPAATFLRQWRVLLARQVQLLCTRGVRTEGRGKHTVLRLWLVGLMPFLIAAGSALLTAEVTGGVGLGRGPSGDPGVALSMLTTLSMLSGQALTYSDLVAEYTVIRRDQRTGVLTTAVMTAKWQIFALVGVLQAAIMTFVFAMLRPGPADGFFASPDVELFLSLSVLSVTAMSLGLLISAASAKLEQAVLTVTLVSVAQIALNGFTADLSSGGPLAWFAALLPDRWGLAAAASLADLRHVAPREQLWRHHSGQWLFDLGMCSMLTIVYSAAATVILAWRLGAFRMSFHWKRPTR